MHDSSFDFLRQMAETPSPSGFERPIQDVVAAWARPLADSVRFDSHGNFIAVRKPERPAENTPRVMLAGHCDSLGLMVQHIDADGFLYVQPIGGWDVAVVLGQFLTVWTKSGPITGVISRKAPHVMTPEERGKVPAFHELHVDIGAKNRAEAEGLVRHGDACTVQLGFRSLRNDLAAAPTMDDKVGVWVVFEALRLLEGRPLRAEIYFVSTVQEEIGLRGAATSAHGIRPHVGVAVDVCHATDSPGSADVRQMGESKLGGGPVLFRGPNINPRVFDKLEESARRSDVPVQVRGTPKATGTDANTIQLSRDGVATALVGIPNRYMHSPVETVHLGDLNLAARLLADFCENVTADDDWTP